MSWRNDDNLLVTFGTEKAEPAIGGSVGAADGVTKMIEIDLDYTDFAASAAVVGTARGKSVHGVWLPKGAVVEKVEFSITTAFTVSGGTADSVQFVIGTAGADDGQTIDADDFTTTSFIGSVLSLEQVGQVFTVDPETTGAGDIYGVALAENAIVIASNPTQATNVLNAGAMKMRVFYR